MRQFILIALLTLAACSPALGQGGGKTEEVRSLEGTTWEGVVRAPNSDGSSTDYEYTFNFLPEGRVSWQWSGNVYTNGTWKQTGNSIRMELNDGYSVWLGRIEGTSMKGAASNKLGHKWDWTLTAKAKGPHTH